jgi:hypothetical protein
MKSKIEEKIKNAREATNEMFAAFDELNESLSEKLEKWLPKRGEYYRVNIDGVVWLCIAAYTEAERVTDFVSLRYESTYLGYNMGTLIRENFYSCTPSEIALLDSKLAEKGKRFDKEKLELVDIPKFKVGDWFIPHKPKVDVFPNWTIGMDRYNNIPCRVSRVTDTGCLMFNLWNFHPDWCEKITAPKHKEPIIGEMAIFWDNNKAMSFIAILTKADNGFYPSDFKSTSWENAILFESIEQYKAFLKS